MKFPLNFFGVVSIVKERCFSVHLNVEKQIRLADLLSKLCQPKKKEQVSGSSRKTGVCEPEAFHGNYDASERLCSDIRTAW